jgi:hypothetical protein
MYFAATPTLAARWLRGLLAMVRGLLLLVFSPVLDAPEPGHRRRGRYRGPWRVGAGAKQAARTARVDPLAAQAVTSDEGVPRSDPAAVASTRALAVACSELSSSDAWAQAAAGMSRAEPASPSEQKPADLCVDAGDFGTLPVMLAVRPTFNPHDYSALFLALATPGSKLIDLSSARLVRADFFEELVAGWRAPSGSVPQLGLLLSFADWAALRDVAAPVLKELTSRGVAAQLFYEEQAYDDMLLLWFSHGYVIHNTAAVVVTLRVRCALAPLAPFVLDAAISLLVQRRLGSSSQIVELAHIALSSGATIKAITLAREALLELGEVATLERFNALRVLGFALMTAEKVIAATGILDGAVEMGIAIGATDAAAEILHYLGQAELDHRDFAAAEARFYAAIELLKPTKSEFQASLYHGLALALLHQGKGTAELNAVTALASRTDKNSPGARADQALLREIRSGRGPAS